jgi:hypothetical protein
VIEAKGRRFILKSLYRIAKAIPVDGIASKGSSWPSSNPLTSHTRVAKSNPTEWPNRAKRLFNTALQGLCSFLRPFGLVWGISHNLRNPEFKGLKPTLPLTRNST